jgi:hypothetical protein
MLAFVAAATIAAGVMLRVGSGASDTGVPRTRFDHPDLQGVWQVQTPANWNLEPHGGADNRPPGFGVVVAPPDGRIPYRPAALEPRERHFASREQDDPLQKCYLAGVPRTMYLPHPLQIFQTKDEVVILSEYVHTWRWIPLFALDRYPGYESWMGDPRGRWEGDTLVVENVGFNGETWLDHAGNFHSNALKVTERFTRSVPDAISYEATLEDPNVYTRPWTIRMQLNRRTDREQILEYECYLYAADAGRRVIGAHPEFEP